MSVACAGGGGDERELDAVVLDPPVPITPSFKVDLDDACRNRILIDNDPKLGEGGGCCCWFITDGGESGLSAVID